MRDRRASSGDLASEVWSVLRDSASALTAAEVRERLSRPLAYSTVVTTLSRLHTKGLLTRVKEGRSHRYAPAGTEPGFTARRMHSALGQSDDRAAVLTHFVSELSGDDEALLRGLLAENRTTGSEGTSS